MKDYRKFPPDPPTGRKLAIALVVVFCAWMLLVVVAKAGNPTSVSNLTFYSAGIKPSNKYLVECLSSYELESHNPTDTPIMATTEVDNRSVFYDEMVCYALSRPKQNPAGLAVALMVVAHEAAHLKGWSNESVAACAGLSGWFPLAHRFFGVQAGTQKSRLMLRAVRVAHNSLPLSYRRSCP